MKAVFNGEIVYTDGSTGEDYLGVWGTRNASRLRRLLRERGAKIVIERQRPQGARLKIKSVVPKR